ncbi:MAG: PH domain-containing protein [Actinomycetota bacterium]|nr:PH domain-containing protein [Actinomycetota bacterium]
MARAAFAVLLVDDHGVTARNPFRTVTVAWSEIATFDLGRYKVLGCVCLIQLRAGTVVPAFAIQGITGQPRRRTSALARQAVDELNQRLARVSAGRAAVKPPGAAGFTGQGSGTESGARA